MAHHEYVQRRCSVSTLWRDPDRHIRDECRCLVRRPQIPRLRPRSATVTHGSGKDVRVDSAVTTSTSSQRGTAAVVVEADAAAAYAVISDVMGYGRFSPENRSAKWLGADSGPAQGAKFRSWNRRGIFRWFTYCVVETADGREFSFRVVFPPPMPKTRWTYRLRPVDDRHTRIEESWELPAPLGPARRTM